MVDTEALSQFPTKIRENMLKTFEQKLPVEHVGKPDEVGEAYILAMKVSVIMEFVVNNMILIPDNCSALIWRVKLLSSIDRGLLV